MTEERAGHSSAVRWSGLIGGPLLALLVGGEGDLTRLYLEVFRGYETGLLAPEGPRTEASTTPTDFATFAKQVLAPALG